jgi:hypothetical protein
MGNLEHWFPKVSLTNAVSTTNHLDMVYKHGHCSEVVDNTYLLYEIWATQGYLYTVPMVSPWGLLKFACMVKSQGH